MNMSIHPASMGASVAPSTFDPSMHHAAALGAAVEFPTLTIIILFLCIIHSLWFVHYKNKYSRSFISRY